jgi:hypothetical protein
MLRGPVCLNIKFDPAVSLSVSTSRMAHPVGAKSLQLRSFDQKVSRHKDAGFAHRVLRLITAYFSQPS